MRYDLIWKSIDAEITEEESSLLMDTIKKEPAFLSQLKMAKQLDQVLVSHFSHKMDTSFLVKLKKSILEEIELPNVKINYLPIVIFIGLAVFLFLSFSYIPLNNHIDLNIDIGVYLPYIMMVTVVSFAGLLLFGLDILLKTKYKRV